MASITAVTIATDEEAHIARALRSVQGLADEIIVVDGGSTDGTVEVARQFTDKVFVNPWPGYGKQKNFALDRATGDWVLFVDADEEVTPALAEEIRHVIERDSARQRGRPPEPSEASPERSAGVAKDPSPRSFVASAPQDDKGKINVYFVRIITEFLGKPLCHLWGTNPRLLRRDAVRWDDRAVHEQTVRPDGSTVRLGDTDAQLLTHSLLHPSHYETLAVYRERRERYTMRDAAEMLTHGTDRLGKPVGDPLRTTLRRAWFLTERAAKQFVRLFVKKRGFLDGWQGWLWCYLSAQYEYMTCKQYLALRRREMSQAPGTPERKGQSTKRITFEL